ncbi:uncharacterized protein EAE97_010689 [Botrytis byssoidea]|uniref:Ecp2 effector protein domain-containing protein n=1 Tax=Botrytis byssoidea TaxID=139641 RepID=A0A9P5LJK3_9HELO|nr:uncharacterized protein EAE97_010689 [Botrytis byssoidea]KAF7924738.1 hypothetical protein EAE97_010689 [Botrytis byssoidea]
MIFTARPSSLISLTVLVVLSITFFSSTVYALPAIDTGPIANLQNENTSTQTVTLDERDHKGNFRRSDEIVAYKNCCGYTPLPGTGGRFVINLAGWGNNDNTPNVVETLTQDDCAPELVKNIEKIGGSINPKTWKCLPSYGAPMDTYVYFVLKKGDNDKVAEALSTTHKIEPAWECLSGHESSEWCKDQQRIAS